jgi:hypothetical protein
VLPVVLAVLFGAADEPEGRAEDRGRELELEDMERKRKSRAERDVKGVGDRQ